MDAYQVNRSVFSLAASSINAPLKAHELKEAESLCTFGHRAKV